MAAADDALIEMDEPEASIVMIDGFSIDASISEEHGFNSEVTEYPVETGGDITDNVRAKPITVTLECIVSDTPLGDFVNIRDSGSIPSVIAYSRLTKIRDKREPVTIITSLDTFENMVLTDLSIPRKAETGHAIEFSATFQQIILVTNNRSTVRVAISTGDRKDLGNPLGLKGDQRVLVFSIQRAFHLTGKRTIAVVNPVLVDALASHYVIYPGSPPADGYVDAKGYHKFLIDPESITRDMNKLLTPKKLTTEQIAKDAIIDKTRTWTSLFVGGVP